MAWFQGSGEVEADLRASQRRRGAIVRSAALAVFAAATAFVVACGHQVTPEPNIANSDLSGKVLIRFDTAGPLNFTSSSYAVVLNTCGSGVVPYPNVYGTTYLSWSYAFFVGGSTAGSSTVTLWQYYYNGGTATKLSIPLNPSQVQFNPDSNGQGTEFSLIFSRSLLNNHFSLPQPCPNVTQPPATSAPTSGATATPTPGTTATPSSSPSSVPTTQAQSTWIFNFMTFTAAPPVGVPEDSLGLGEGSDTTFQGVDIDVNSLSQMPIFRVTPPNPPANSSAQITGGEIDNYP